MTEAQMSGEQLEKARRSRKIWIIFLVVLFGLGVGFMVGFSQGENLFAGGGSWPPAMAAGLACAYVAAVIGGSIAMSRNTDEFERLRSYQAVSVGAFFYILLYPVWFLLWMGGLVPEPSHELLFIGFYLASFSGFLFYRFR